MPSNIHIADANFTPAFFAAAGAFLTSFIVPFPGAWLRIYSGPQPADTSADLTEDNVLLVQMNFASPHPFPLYGGGTTAFADTTTLAAPGITFGIATFFRISDIVTGAAIIDGTVGPSDSDIALGSVTIHPGDTIRFSFFAIQAVNGDA